MLLIAMLVTTTIFTSGVAMRSRVKKGGGRGGEIPPSNAGLHVAEMMVFNQIYYCDVIKFFS